MTASSSPFSPRTIARNEVARFVVEELEQRRYIGCAVFIGHR
jgi:hypothetical protein